VEKRWAFKYFGKVAAIGLYAFELLELERRGPPAPARREIARLLARAYATMLWGRAGVSREAAARSRSFIASPIPDSGIGATAIVRAAWPSRLHKW
jgi:hypothetical protein